MNITRPSYQNWFLALLIINLVASVCHYSDNLLHFDQYPEPDWFQPLLTDSIWLVMTPFAFAGYWLYCKGSFPWAYVCFYIYGAMSLIVFGHYTVLPLWEVSWKINLLIWGEAIPAFFLLGFTAWSQYQQPKHSAALD
jgi:hypothetical protein